jgi:hypothetical protein
VKSAFHRNPKIFTGKNFAKKKKNRFSFISMPVWAVTKTKNFMKKVKMLLVVSVFILGLVSFVSPINAKADCPNGCLDNGGGCWCHAWYPCLREAGGGIALQ